jgi:prevent-host-death family protein
MFEKLNLIEDILDLDTTRANLDQIVDEVADDHAQKVIIRNNKPAALLVNIADFQAMQEHILAMEFEMGIREMKEEQKRDELFDWDETLEELGIDLKGKREKPEGYDLVIPERYRHVS